MASSLSVSTLEVPSGDRHSNELPNLYGLHMASLLFKGTQDVHLWCSAPDEFADSYVFEMASSLSKGTQDVKCGV